jgi:hypothetical protein
MKGNIKETFRNLKKETKGVVIGSGGVIIALVITGSVMAMTSGGESSTTAEVTTIEETTTVEATTVEQTTIAQESTTSAVQQTTQAVIQQTAAPTIQEAANAQYFTYQMVGDGISITAYNGNETNIIIPNTINGYKVINIGSCVFRGKKNIISVNIPETVTTIGGGAFLGCDSLVSVYIPSAVSSIGSDCFSIGISINPDGSTKNTYGSLNLSVANSSYGMQYAIDNGIPYSAY